MSLLLITLSGMVLIVLSADYFTNGIEWVGFRLHLDEGAVGSLLAALGTALPETLVPVIAILFGQGTSENPIGLGAILGAPFMLSTVGFLVIGAGLLWAGRQSLTVENGSHMTADLAFFLVAFGLAIVASLLPGPWHPYLAVGLLGLYAFHAVALVKGGGEAKGPASHPSQGLRLSTRPDPPFWLALLQVVLALLGLIIGAHFFVTALDGMTGIIHLSAFLLAVIVTPVATELPEVLNSVIWIRRHKDTLAVGNVTGAMAFQSSVVPALGIGLTPWHLDALELLTGIVTWLAALWIWLRSRQGPLMVSELIAAGLFYVLYIGMVIAMTAR